MSANWVANLDMLAQNGVIDFDAPAYVLGQAPRYVGNPKVVPPFIGQMPNAPLINQPQPINDEFMPSDKNKNYVKNPLWKKLLFGAVTAGALIFGGYKLKNKFVPGMKKMFKNFSIKKTGKSIGDFFKNGWTKFTNLFKSKKKTP